MHWGGCYYTCIALSQHAAPCVLPQADPVAAGTHIDEEIVRDVVRLGALPAAPLRQTGWCFRRIGYA